MPGGDEQTAEALEMLLGLPGRMYRDDALDLLPLAGEALTVGWTVSGLRDHLSRRCDPDRRPSHRNRPGLGRRA
ncbi:hypothetical protein [Streptomyces sp. NPDC057909]|uniref:hypothetical protein n=1 Tax=Streptomyces sp. NPDC057909 TaxID=3346277 RepID=UPI0036E48CA2